MTDYNHDPCVPTTGLAANLAAYTAYPNELLWTTDTQILYIEQGGVKVPIGGSIGVPHNVLSATHLDSTPAACVRGDIITGQGVNPTWCRLAVGAAGTYLAGGTEPAWATLNQAAVAGLTTASSSQFVGITLTGNLTLPSTGWAGLASDKGRIIFTDAATDTIVFSDCNVGVGCVPGVKLDVIGSGLQLRVGSSASESVYLYGGDAGSNTAAIGYTGTALRVWDGSANVMIFKSGNVGFNTVDLDGTPAIGKVTIKGSTNDGSTNIWVGRDSDEANVAYLETNGGLWLAGTLHVDGVATFDGQVDFGTAHGTTLLIDAIGGHTSDHTLSLCGLNIVAVSESYNDEAYTNLPSATVGMLWVSMGAETGLFRVTSDGSIVSISMSAGMVNTGADGYVCVYQIDAYIRIRNRTGSAQDTRILYIY